MPVLCVKKTVYPGLTKQSSSPGKLGRILNKIGNLVKPKGLAKSLINSFNISFSKEFDDNLDTENQAFFKLSLKRSKTVSQSFQKFLAARESFNFSSKDKLISLSNSDFIPKDGIFQVILVGGSHLESALVKKSGENLKILEFEQEKIGQLVGKKSFFDLIGRHIKKDKTRFVSLSLAYPLELVERGDLLDGVLTGSPKEHKLSDLVGLRIGESLESYIQENFNQRISFSVCNNLQSLAFLVAQNKRFKKTETATGVVATGLNFGFFDKDGFFINLESGDCSDFRPLKSTRFIDQNSHEKGKHLFEKEVSEKYLWQHFNYWAKKRGWLFRLYNHFQFRDLVKSYQKGYSTAFSRLAYQILMHSAALVAGQIAGIYFYKKKTKKNLERLNFLLEGSLFWEVSDYKDLVEKFLQKLEVNVSFIRVKHSFVLGSSGAILQESVQSEIIIPNYQPEFILHKEFYYSQAPPLLNCVIV